MGVKIEKLEHGMYRIPLQGLELEHITFDGTGKRPEFTLQLTDGRKPLYFECVQLVFLVNLSYCYGLDFFYQTLCNKKLFTSFFVIHRNNWVIFYFINFI